MVRLFGFDGRFAAVQIGHQGLKAGTGQPVCNASDLVIQPPPFLNNHHRRCMGDVRGFGQIALKCFSIGSLKVNQISHSHLQVDR